jgi:hypothetical protein
MGMVSVTVDGNRRESYMIEKDSCFFVKAVGKRFWLPAGPSWVSDNVLQHATRAHPKGMSYERNMTLTCW